MTQEGAMYKIYDKMSGGRPENVTFMQFSRIIDGFRQPDLKGFIELMKLRKQNP